MIDSITNKNPDIFLSKELDIRRKNNLPPYQRFISIIISSKNEKKLYKQSLEFKNYLVNKLNSLILGPVNAPIYKIRNNFKISPVSLWVPHKTKYFILFMLNT